MNSRPRHLNPISRTLTLICILLLAVSLHNLLRWRTESRAFEQERRGSADGQGYLIEPGAKLPGMHKMDLDNARLGVELAVLKAQNLLLRDHPGYRPSRAGWKTASASAHTDVRSH